MCVLQMVYLLIICLLSYLIHFYIFQMFLILIYSIVVIIKISKLVLQNFTLHELHKLFIPYLLEEISFNRYLIANC